eukprot:5304697-Amphidinium_carterae.1
MEDRPEIRRLPRTLTLYDFGREDWMLVVSSGHWKNGHGLQPWNVDVGEDPYDIFGFLLIGWDGPLNQEAGNAKT